LALAGRIRAFVGFAANCADPSQVARHGLVALSMAPAAIS
jgi:hypothetical protein